MSSLWLGYDEATPAAVPEVPRPAFTTSERLPSRRLPVNETTNGRAKTRIPDAVKAAVRAVEGCEYCGERSLPLEVDHVRPRTRGGTDDRSNLVAACISCNSQKRAMLVHEWRLWREHHGMPWPPVASHPTDPAHFGDSCKGCSPEQEDERAARTGRHAPVGYRMDPTPYGWLVYFRCENGHGAWTCGYSNEPGYYSDCTCMFCRVSRLEAGDQCWCFEADAKPHAAHIGRPA